MENSRSPEETVQKQCLVFGGKGKNGFNLPKRKNLPQSWVGGYRTAQSPELRAGQ